MVGNKKETVGNGRKQLCTGNFEKIGKRLASKAFFVYDNGWCIKLKKTGGACDVYAFRGGS